MKKKYRWNKKKFVANMFILAMVGLVAWMGISYIDVVAHNLNGGTHSAWNLFSIILK